VGAAIKEEKRGSNGVSDAVERDKRKTMAGRCLLSYRGGKIKRDLRATNPKSERRKRGSRSSRPTDGRTDERTERTERWMDRERKESKERTGTHACAGRRRRRRPTSACLLLLRLIILHFI
jgi:hypothetical protein